MNENTWIKDKQHTSKGNTEASKDMSHFDIVQNKTIYLESTINIPN